MLDTLLISSRLYEGEDYKENLKLRYFQNLHSDLALTYEAAYDDTNGDNQINMGVDFFFNKKASVGLKHFHAGSDESIRIGFDYYSGSFFNPGLAHTWADAYNTAEISFGLRY